MEHAFETPEPVQLYVEFGRGRLVVTATETQQTTVTVTGKRSEEVQVEHDGTSVSVTGPRDNNGFFNSGEARLDVAVTVPTDSELITKTGSADQTTEGRFTHGHLKSGSGDISIDEFTGPLVINTGSGDALVGSSGDDLRVKSGSGDLKVRHATGSALVSTGSGDITFEQADADLVAKSGSGDLTIRVASGDLRIQTASGDVTVGEFSRGNFTSKNASGDIVVGIPSGIPVWTDINTVSGGIRSDLAGAGQPGDGQDHIELRATTVSGDITLKQL